MVPNPFIELASNPVATLALVGFICACWSARVILTQRSADRVRAEWARACESCIRVADNEVPCSQVCGRAEKK